MNLENIQGIYAERWLERDLHWKLTLLACKKNTGKEKVLEAESQYKEALCQNDMIQLRYTGGPRQCDWNGRKKWVTETLEESREDRAHWIPEGMRLKKEGV